MAPANALDPYAVRTCFVMPSELNNRSAAVDQLLTSISLYGDWSMSVQYLFRIYCRSEAGTELARSKNQGLLLERVFF